MGHRKNVHVFKLEQRRIKRVEIALKVYAERETLFRSGSLISKQKRASGDTLTIMTAPTSDFYLTLPSNASTSVYPNNGPSGFKVALPNVHELQGMSGKWAWPVLSIGKWA